jgi:hypothetical protein
MHNTFLRVCPVTPGFLAVHVHYIAKRKILSILLILI